MEQASDSVKNVQERIPLQKIDTKRKRKISNDVSRSANNKRRRTKEKSPIKEQEKQTSTEDIIEIDCIPKPEEKENVKVSPVKPKQDVNRKRKVSTENKVLKIDAMFKKMKNKAAKPINVDVVQLESDEETVISEDVSVESEKTGESNTPLKANLDSTTNSVDEAIDDPNKNLMAEKDTDAKQVKKMTPKQLEKEKERQQKKEEREKARLAKEEEKERIRQQKEKERLELQKAKEEKLKKKQEFMESKQKEREEKQKKKDEEKQKKEDERQKKEEERLKKEEEKLKREEEKKQAEEEQKEKAQKMKAKFTNFFVAKKTKADTEEVDDKETTFMMFQVKDNMRLAPLVRSDFTEERKQTLDSLLEGNKSTGNYLADIKSKSYSRGESYRTYEPLSEKSDECEILDGEDDEEECLENTTCVLEPRPTNHKRAKLLHFCENRRPAYFGTWSKKSTKITGRNPFGREDNVFDYEYDSDDDWEEEEAGESLSDSEGEDAEEGEDQYEVDNDVFVPHGYLSDDEGIEEDADSEDESSKSKEDQSGEVQKKKLKEKQEEFEQEMKQKTKQLKPKVYGCVWMDDPESHPAYDQLVKIFWAHKCIPLGSTCPVGTTKGGSNIPVDPRNAKKVDDSDEPTSMKKFAKEFPEKAIPDLIKLIHGNHHNKLFLIREFKAYMSKGNANDAVKSGLVAGKKIELKILEIAQYEKHTDVTPKRKTWKVSQEVLDKYMPEGLPENFEWSYTLTPQKKKAPECKSEQKPSEETEKSTPKPKSAKSLITRFTKVMSEEEKSSLIAKETPSRSPCTPVNQRLQKKEITLTPIPLNNAQPKATSSITKFFHKQKMEAIPESKDDACITLDWQDLSGSPVIFRL